MPDLTTIKFGEVSFDEAIRALRDMVPMTDAEFGALDALAKQRAFSFADAYTDSMAKAVQNILADTVAGKIPTTEFMDRANAVLAEYGTSLTSFQAQTIFETSLSRVFNDGSLRRVMNNPLIQSAYPYFGIDTAADSRVRPNHYALDWRRIRTVFPITDMLLTAWPLPAGYRCRCARRFFSEAQVAEYGLTVGRGEEWYGRPVEVAVPGHGTQVVNVLPDSGFGAALTGKALSTQLELCGCGILLLAHAQRRAVELTGEQPQNLSDGHWITHDGHPLFVPDTPEQKEQIARGTEAINKALATHADVPNAMSRPGFDEIDLRWSYGTQGKGVAGILRDHTEMDVRMIPFAIARGQHDPAAAHGNNQIIKYHGWIAVLTKTEGRDPRHWVLTNFHPDENWKGKRR